MPMNYLAWIFRIQLTPWSQFPLKLCVYVIYVHNWSGGLGHPPITTPQNPSFPSCQPVWFPQKHFYSVWGPDPFKAPPMTFLNTSIPVKFFVTYPSIRSSIHSANRPGRQAEWGYTIKKQQCAGVIWPGGQAALFFLTVGCTDRQGERGAAGGCDCWLHIDSIYGIDSHNIVH